MKFVLPLKAFMNAIKMQANNDVRYYLNGVHIRKGKIESTSGHCAYVATLKDYENPEYIDFEYELPGSMIINMKQKIAKPLKKHGAEFCVIDSEECDATVTVYSQFGEKLGVYLGEVVDGKFPDMDRLFSSLTDEDKTTEPVGLNAEYLAMLKPLSDSKWNQVKVQQYGPNKACHFEMIDALSIHFKQDVLIMPSRL